jgi:hypothetical protein
LIVRFKSEGEEKLYDIVEEKRAKYRDSAESGKVGADVVIKEPRSGILYDAVVTYRSCNYNITSILLEKLKFNYSFYNEVVQ